MDSTFFQQRLDLLRARLANIREFQKQYEKELRLVSGNSAAETRWKERIKGLQGQREDLFREHQLLVQQVASIQPESSRSGIDEQLLRIEHDLEMLQRGQDALLREEGANARGNTATNWSAPEHPPNPTLPDRDQASREAEVQAQLNALRQRIQSFGAPTTADIDSDNIANPEISISSQPTAELPNPTPATLPQAEPIADALLKEEALVKEEDEEALVKEEDLANLTAGADLNAEADLLASEPLAKEPLEQEAEESPPQQQHELEEDVQPSPDARPEHDARLDTRLDNNATLGDAEITSSVVPLEVPNPDNVSLDDSIAQPDALEPPDTLAPIAQFNEQVEPPHERVPSNGIGPASGVTNMHLEEPHRPVWGRKRNLMIFLVLLATLLPIGFKLSSDIKAALQQKEEEKTCSLGLKKTGDRKQDFLANQRVLEACIALKDRNPNNVSALKNAGRASLLTWSSASDESTKKNVIDRSREYFRQAVDASGKKDPQALFYWKFMDDFEEFTSKAKDKSKQNFQCDMKVSERYKEALEIYNPPNGSNAPYKISQGDEFILLELSHFLMNRDVGYQNAVDLLDSVLKANPDPEHKDKILKNIWLSKAGAETRLNRYDQVRDSLIKALEYDPKSYKIIQDLGSAYAQLSINDSSQNKDRDRELAIAEYQKITQNSDTANSYRAWRNLSFLLYLEEKYADAVQAFEKTLTFKAALSESDQENAGLIQGYRDLSIACSTGGDCSPARKDVLEKELRDRQIFSNYFITHDLIETEVKDPFFDVEHDVFYKCQK